MKKFFALIGIITVGALLWYFKPKPVIQVVEKQTYLTDTVTVFRDKYNITHAKITERPIAFQKMKDAISKEYYSYTTDTLLPALKIAEREIARLTRVNAKLQGAANRVDTVVMNGGLVFKNKYMTIQTSDSNASYIYNATLDILEYRKKNWLFGKDQYYLDISSPDTSFKIHGLKTYRKPFYPDKDKLKISLLTSARFSRSIGINTGLMFKYNPDGIFSPYLGVGREWFIDGRPSMYLTTGAEFNIYRR